MREPRSENGGRTPWHVPLALENVPETGQHLDLVASAEVRAGVARMAGLRDLPRLQASFEVTRHGSGLRARGRVSATVGQACVVTLEPLASDVEEALEVADIVAVMRNQTISTLHDLRTTSALSLLAAISAVEASEAENARELVS